MKDAVKKVLVFLIRTYQLTISPIFSHGSCRYYPTCSQYALSLIHILKNGDIVSFLKTDYEIINED